MEDNGYLQILADNPELYLEEMDYPAICEQKDAIDINNSNSITVFGTDIQKKMSDLSEMMIKNIGDSSIDEVGDLIDQTVGYLSTVDDEEEDKKILFWKKKSKSLSVKTKYDTIYSNVEKVQESLQNHQVQLMKECAMLDQVYNMNKDYYKQVNIRIAAVKDKIKEIQSGKYNDMADGLASNWSEEIIERLERKVEELEVSRTISLQQAPQIRMLQANQATMADKLQSTLYNVIPLWKNQIVLAFGAEHTRQAIAADKKLTDMTNHLLIKNAENLKMVTTETMKARNENTIDVNALAKTNKILLESLDEISRIREEGKIKRSNAELELVRIDEEMKTGLMML